MPLHTQQLGDGPDIVLLHGWGMQSRIFAPLMERLAGRFRVTLIDLPGHGGSPEVEHCEIECYIEQLLDAAPHTAAWVGWSLGGMLATAVAARYPERVTRLVLLASSPRFVQDADWSAAMQPEVLAGFGAALADEPMATIKRFLSLVARGAPNADVLRELRGQILQAEPPTLAGLQCGLDFLGTLDLRDELSRLAQPLLALLGERDTLVPVAVGEAMRQLNPGMTIDVVKQAGHAPFLSHVDSCYERMERFLV